MTTNQAFTILAQAGGVRAARIITENNPILSRFRVWSYARMLRRGVPVAKIIGKKWFFGLQFYTNKHTLDPRPDTETLVSAVISDCGAGIKNPRILDIGTGTGCVIVSLIKNIHGAHGTAIDISRGAIRVARRNIKKHNLENKITIKRMSFAKKMRFNTPFDIIVSNPPYIARGDTRVDTGASFDPKMALYAASDGYAAYQAIAINARDIIVPRGKIYLEIGIGMGKRVREIFHSAGWKFERAENDLSGTERVLVFSNPTKF